MAITCYWNEVIGKVVSNYGENLTLYTGGNVTAVVCCDTTDNEGETLHTLVSFICDKAHLENMLKDGVFEGWHNWELNYHYSRDAMMIAKLLLKYGFSVTITHPTEWGKKLPHTSDTPVSKNQRKEEQQKWQE